MVWLKEYHLIFCLSSTDGYTLLVLVNTVPVMKRASRFKYFVEKV